jgi:predicted SPOUT superfamily RNA methylase MTH1
MAKYAYKTGIVVRVQPNTMVQIGKAAPIEVDVEAPLKKRLKTGMKVKVQPMIRKRSRIIGLMDYQG